MTLKDIKIGPFSKLILIATIIVILMSRLPIFEYVTKSISPLIVAFILAYVIDYSVRFFENKVRLKRWISILISVVLFLAILILLGLVVVPNIIDAVASLIKTIGTVDFNFDFSFINQIDFENVYLKQLQQTLIDTVMPILQKLTNFTGTVVLFIVSEIQQITSGLISLLISFVIAVYMLAEKKDLTARIKRLAYAYFSDQHIYWIKYTLLMSDKIFKDFVIGKFIDSTIIGFLSYFVFIIFDFKYAVLIALIVGVTNMIPYFGPFIGAVPAAIITLIANPTDPVQMLYMLLLIFIIQQLDGLVIGPFILGDSVGVTAFWIIVAVTVGGAAFGIIGMFLGVPVCVLIKTLIEEDVQRRLEHKGYPSLESENLKIKGSRRTKKT